MFNIFKILYCLIGTPELTVLQPTGGDNALLLIHEEHIHGTEVPYLFTEKNRK